MRSILASWFDANSTQARSEARGDDHRVDWARFLPFVVLHVGAVAAPFTGISSVAVWTCIGLYVARMFFVTAFYHRYFAHRTFRTGRKRQFGMALLGTTSAQRGPLWWAAHHRKHHKWSDRERDAHSPRHGLWHSHVTWFMRRDNLATDLEQVRDLARFRELRFLDRFDTLGALVLAFATYAGGVWLEQRGVATSGAQMLCWGFCLSTVLLFHCTSLVNSAGHLVGSRPYDTGDDSRNSAWLALLTFGEGWHNNHHRYPVAARQGFRWWQWDLSYYGLWALAALGVIHDLRPVPAEVVEEGRRRRR
ncbi:MAG: acyl-CoA desaturase [Planctomycetota bacterium]